MKFTLKILLLTLVITGPAKISLAQKLDKNNQIKWSPVRIGDIANPGVELGYERLYDGGNFSTQLSYGYMRDLVKATGYDNYRGSRFSLEEKYYHKRGRILAFYFAFEVVRLDVNYGKSSTFYKDTSRLSLSYRDDYNVSKQTLTFNTKYGLQIPLPIKNFLMDVTAGVGVKHRKVVWSDVDDRNAIISKSRHPNFSEITDREGNEWVFNVPINFKLCYQF